MLFVLVIAAEPKKATVAAKPVVLDTAEADPTPDGTSPDFAIRAPSPDRESESSVRLISPPALAGLDDLRPSSGQVEIDITKLGVPWRGSYERVLVIANGHVATFDPHTRRMTNVWFVPRDMPRVVHRMGEGVVELHVAPWPAAPSWLAQPVRFTAPAATIVTAVEALTQKAKVVVECI